jgi:leader peptidase (prepilin peptidase) / N-methyltransferase
MGILVAITFIDLEHRIIPDVLSIGGLVWGIGTCWMDSALGWTSALFGAVFGFSIFYLVAWIYLKARNRSGLGGGDIKFLAMLGAYLGPSGVFVTMFVSSVFGCTLGLIWALTQGKRGREELMQVSLPFGPFLVFGALYFYFFGDRLWLPSMTPM